MRVNFLTIARLARPLILGKDRVEFDALLDDLERTANAAPLNEWKGQAAAMFAAGMQPVGSAIAAALHAGTEDALRGLRHLLPGMLREVDRSAPVFPEILESGMLRAFFSEFASDPIQNSELKIQNSIAATANAIDVAFSDDPTITAAMDQWRGRTHLPTDLGSAELRGLSQEVKLRSIFSARTTNASYLEDVAEAVDDLLAGKINMATARLRLMQRLAELGYDPAKGFPGDMAHIPPAEVDSLQDLSSVRRLDLMLDTNLRIASNYAKVVAGNTDYSRRAYPAWELVRLYPREVPRGTTESHTAGWRERWLAAGGSVDWEGAVDSPLVALKDSPIWQALGDGDGGDWCDTLGNPFPPFAFNSGMAFAAVPRSRADELGLLNHAEVPAPMKAQLWSPAKAKAVLDSMGPNFKADLLKSLEETIAA